MWEILTFSVKDTFFKVICYLFRDQQKCWLLQKIEQLWNFLSHGISVRVQQKCVLVQSGQKGKDKYEQIMGEILQRSGISAKTLTHETSKNHLPNGICDVACTCPEMEQSVSIGKGKLYTSQRVLQDGQGFVWNHQKSPLWSPRLSPEGILLDFSDIVLVQHRRILQ